MPTQQAVPANLQPIEPEARYTYAQVAELLDMDEEGVKRLVYSGRLGHVELNAKKWRILGRQLSEYIARQTRGAVR